MSDDLLFADENDDEFEQEGGSGYWKVLIVDDEPEVHVVTKLALSDLVFQDRKLEFFSAYSGQEAKDFVSKHKDIAVILLDVVMETDDAGLQVADFVRNCADNHFCRIILRTGQPGQAPERDIILNYDINDYKSKTELTAQKLYIVMIASLRSYKDIMVIEENRQGLEKIVSASADLFSLQSLESFIEGMLQQLVSLVGGSKDIAYMTTAVAGLKTSNGHAGKELVVFAGKGEYSGQEGQPLIEVVLPAHLAGCEQALQNQTLTYGEDYLAAYCCSNKQKGGLLYLTGIQRALTDVDKTLIQIFSQNVQVAFENVLLTKDIEDTQNELVQLLAQALEQDLHAGNHRLRIIKIAEVLARKLGMSNEEIDLLKLVVPLHDVSHLHIPESLLNKSPTFEQARDSILKQFNVGNNLMDRRSHEVTRAAIAMARDHNEHWDGNGSPRHVKGEDINIYSRITAVADVYEALSSERGFKPAWDNQQAKAYFQQRRGTQFDPTLVDILFESLDEIEHAMTSLTE